ncbi:MAG TPA: hypothetical protein VIJ06_08685 [Methylovirgula sp.]
MMKLIPILATAGLMLASITFQAEAMPAAQVGAHGSSSHVTLVRDGCGHGRHRGPHGHCRRNWH